MIVPLHRAPVVESYNYEQCLAYYVKNKSALVYFKTLSDVCSRNGMKPQNTLS